MREGFQAVVSGWMLIDDFDHLTDRIEQASLWAQANGPLEPDEARTVELMIEDQIVRGMPELAVFLTGSGASG